MSSPMRVSDDLFSEAEIEGALMKRSAAKQVEYWAALGKQIAHTVAPKDVLALMQGIARVRVEISSIDPIDPMAVFDDVEQQRVSGELSAELTQGRLNYELSTKAPGFLVRIAADGSRVIGSFKDGTFIPKK